MKNSNQKSTRGGTSEQHAAAGRQSHKNQKSGSQSAPQSRAKTSDSKSGSSRW